MLDTLTEDQIHRGNIEKVLVQSLYHDYTKIYRFCGQSQREFMKLIMKGYEIELINYCPVSYTHLDVYKRQGSSDHAVKTGDEAAPVMAGRLMIASAFALVLANIFIKRKRNNR